MVNCGKINLLMSLLVIMISAVMMHSWGTPAAASAAATAFASGVWRPLANPSASWQGGRGHCVGS